jgi:hypothetical protein
MLLGALAPDAHTEAPGLDRTFLHHEPGQDAVAYVADKVTPADALADLEGRAFAVSCIAHLVADEICRHGPPDLPESAPAGFLPAHQAPRALAAGTFDLGALCRALRTVPARYGLAPLTPAMIDAKRLAVLDRPPLSEATESVVLVEALSDALDTVVAETLARLRASQLGRGLLTGPRAP